MHDPYTGFIKYTGHFFPPLLENAFKNTKILAFLSPSPFSKSCFQDPLFSTLWKGERAPGTSWNNKERESQQNTCIVIRRTINKEYQIVLLVFFPKFYFFPPFIYPTQSRLHVLYSDFKQKKDVQ